MGALSLSSKHTRNELVCMIKIIILCQIHLMIEFSDSFPRHYFNSKYRFESRRHETNNYKSNLRNGQGEFKLFRFNWNIKVTIQPGALGGEDGADGSKEPELSPEEISKLIDEENKDIEDIHKMASPEMPTSSVTYPLKKKLQDLLLTTDTVAILEKVDSTDMISVFE